MVKYKAINTKRGRRYVKVLANGQYRFVKKSVYDRAKGRSKKRSSTSRSKSKKGGNPRRMSKGAFFKTLSIVGALEDAVWGYMGFNLLGRTPAALPFTRAVQGIQGYALDRRGKGRLLYSIIDLIDLYLSGAIGLGGNGTSRPGLYPLLPFDALRNLLKVRPL